MTKRSRRDRGRRSGQYPLGTIATYGPDNTRATKLVAAVVDRPDRDPSAMRKWTVDEGDVRRDPAVAAEVAAFLRERHVAHTATADRVMGCPHEEGIDYPMGRSCPRCPFWAGRDRLTHELTTVPPPSLSVVEVLRALATDSDETRSAALASADAHRDALVEPLLAAVDRALANPIDASDEDADLFSYALYLFAKWREPRAYRAVVRWLSLPDEQPFDIGGDIVTQDGARILAAVCDGDLGPIKALILDRAANEYGRGAGLSAMALLAAWAELPREPIGEHFRWLAREGLEREASQAWDSLVLACIEVEAIEVFPDLRRAYDEGLADPRFITPGELDDVEAEARGGRLEATRERYAPITDVAEATRWWNRRWAGPDDGASNEDDLDEVPQPYVAPPRIGRNEPCPCGSGKKYKKCHGQ